MQRFVRVTTQWILLVLMSFTRRNSCDELHNDSPGLFKAIFTGLKIKFSLLLFYVPTFLYQYIDKTLMWSIHSPSYWLQAVKKCGIAANYCLCFTILSQWRTKKPSRYFPELTNKTQGISRTAKKIQDFSRMWQPCGMRMLLSTVDVGGQIM